MKTNQHKRAQFSVTWQSHHTVWTVWLFCKNKPAIVAIAKYHGINQHCCVFMDQECQRTARAKFHSPARSIPNKRIWDPITRGEIKLLLPERTVRWDKIHKDLSSFCLLTRAAPYTVSPSISISLLLWWALWQIKSLPEGRGQITQSVRQQLHYPTYSGVAEQLGG